MYILAKNYPKKNILESDKITILLKKNLDQINN